jgi:hypothetical protein
MFRRAAPPRVRPMVVAWGAVAYGMFRRTEPEQRQMAPITGVLGAGTAPATDGKRQEGSPP